MEDKIETVEYGGFWKRAIAFFIDFILLGFFISLITGIGIPDSITIGREPGLAMNFEISSREYYMMFFGWLYFSSFESSTWQGTPGKKVMSMRVTNKAGERLSFLHASGRYFAKILSYIPMFLGFVMAAFTEKKQALHDFAAGTVVVNKK